MALARPSRKMREILNTERRDRVFVATSGMQYNRFLMGTNTTQTGLCNADRSQRKHCVYFHEKTGRCTKPADDSTWQTNVVRPPGVKTR